MIIRRIVPAALAIGLLFPTAAHAQRRQPAEDSLAVGGAAGVFFPADSQLDTAPYLEGQVAFYFTPRVALRFGVGWTNPGFDRERDDSLRQFRLGADVLYNWEHGTWHPYVGAGFAAHILQLKDNGRDIGDGESKPGGALLGGIEYFFTRTATLTGEARYQFVGDTRNGLSPSGFLLAAGVKQYF